MTPIFQWKASSGASAYRIFWREAWGPDWQHEMLVGNVTETTLPNALIDNLVFGVAAVDARRTREPRVALHRAEIDGSRCRRRQDRPAVAVVTARAVH